MGGSQKEVSLKDVRFASEKPFLLSIRFQSKLECLS